MSISEGHRERLRNQFIESPETLSEIEILELLLTYAIPRRDVAPLAKSLIASLGSLETVLSASQYDLLAVDGVGKSTAVFIQIVGMVSQMSKGNFVSPQLTLFDLGSKADPKAKNASPKERSMRIFTDDEVANALYFLPKAATFNSIEEYRTYLFDNLPYNAGETRRRRASYILDRFYSEGRINTPLTFYTSNSSSLSELKPAIFYHILQAEPLVVKVAEELIYPFLPIGRVNREQIREFITNYVPNAGLTSIKKILTAIFHTYDLLSVASASEDQLRFNLRPGSLEGFIYVITSEFPEPGIYSYDTIFDGPAHRWLLWDRQWIRKQLYVLRDLGIISKISEIDTVKQFTLDMDQESALSVFYDALRRKSKIIRDAAQESELDTPLGE